MGRKGGFGGGGGGGGRRGGGGGGAQFNQNQRMSKQKKTGKTYSTQMNKKDLPRGSKSGGSGNSSGAVERLGGGGGNALARRQTRWDNKHDRRAAAYRQQLRQEVQRRREARETRMRNWDEFIDGFVRQQHQQAPRATRHPAAPPARPPPPSARTGAPDRANAQAPGLWPEQLISMLGVVPYPTYQQHLATVFFTIGTILVSTICNSGLRLLWPNMFGSTDEMFAPWGLTFHSFTCSLLGLLLFWAASPLYSPFVHRVSQLAADFAAAHQQFTPLPDQLVW